MGCLESFRFRTAVRRRNDFARKCFPIELCRCAAVSVLLLNAAISARRSLLPERRASISRLELQGVAVRELLHQLIERLRRGDQLIALHQLECQPDFSACRFRRTGASAPHLRISVVADQRAKGIRVEGRGVEIRGRRVAPSPRAQSAVARRQLCGIARRAFDLAAILIQLAGRSCERFRTVM